MRHLHTAVSDEINRVCAGDPERAAEMRAESPEYHAEISGRFDWDDDPADYDERDEYDPAEEDEGEEDDEEDEGEEAGDKDEGWDGNYDGPD